MQFYKKTIAAIILIIFVSLQFNIFTYASTNWSLSEDMPLLNIDTPSAILLDSKTGNILYEKNSDAKMYPASITKIMTAILALEKLNLDTKITYSKSAVMSIEFGSSNAGFVEGEELTLEQSLYALLLWSANESANAIAEKVSGSTENFAKLMTKRAKEIGAKNTNFVNSNGLHDPQHYTTAYDMAIIAKHAMSLPEFRKIVSTVNYTIPTTNKMPEIKEIHNKNQLIVPTTRYYYPNAIGIKTGYTTAAGATLVSAAKKDNKELIAVVLNSPIVGNNSYCYLDSVKMFDYGFKNFDILNVITKDNIINNINVEKSLKDISVIPQNKYSILVPKNLDIKEFKVTNQINKISVPVKKGDVVGYSTVKYGSEEIGKINLVSNDTIDKNSIFLSTMSKLKAFFIFILIILKWVAIVVGGLLLIFIIITIIHNKKRLHKKKQKRRKLN